MTLEELLNLLANRKALDTSPVFVVLVERRSDGYYLLDYGLHTIETLMNSR